DVARKNGLAIDISKMSEQLGVKIIPVNAREAKGIIELKRAIQTTIPIPAKDFVDVHSLAPEAIDRIKIISETQTNYTAFQIARQYINVYCLNVDQKKKIKEVLDQYQLAPAKLQGEEIVKRYEKITPIIASSTSQDKSRQQRLDETAKIDRVLLHPVFGYI